MIRYLALGVMALWMAACSAHDEHYYAIHPQALQQALDLCPNKAPQKLSCRNLERLATRINKFAFEARSNPQAFGEKILHLQETIAQQENKLKALPDELGLHERLLDNKKQLSERLAVARWLLSPEG